MTAAVRDAGPQSEVCRELKTARLLAIGPLGAAERNLSNRFEGWQSRDLRLEPTGPDEHRDEEQRVRDPGDARPALRRAGAVHA